MRATPEEVQIGSPPRLVGAQEVADVVQTIFALFQVSPEEKARLMTAVSEIRAAEIHPELLTAPNDPVAAGLQAWLAENRPPPTKGEGLPVQVDVMFDPQDLHWVEAAYGKFREVIGHPLRDPRPAPSDHSVAVGDKVRVGVLGDWGTNLYGARPAAQSIAADGQYDVLVHLGDVYYAGTATEIDTRFLEPWRLMTAGQPRAISRACNSNHEMYSGGGPFFSKTVVEFGQVSSMWALHNADWLLVGLDSAYHDGDLDLEQLTWLNRLLTEYSHQRVVLFSHHQPYSQLSGQNDRLCLALKTHLDSGRVAAWYWGHEHLAAFYDRTDAWRFYGRCIGHSGMPYRRDTRLRSAVSTALKDDLAFRHIGPRGFANDPGRPPVPAARILDGPNAYLGDDAEHFGPNGYLRLEFHDRKLTEILLTPSGSELWRNAID